MIVVKVDWKIDEAAQSLELAHKQVIAAAARSINRAIDAAAITGARQVAEAAQYPIRVVRKRFVVRHCRANYLIAETEALPYAPNLAAFGRPVQKAAGVAATAWEGRKIYRRSFLSRTGKVVARVGVQRYPLKGLRGPSVRKLFMRPAILTRVAAIAWDTFDKRFAHELQRASLASE